MKKCKKAVIKLKNGGKKKKVRKTKTPEDRLIERRLNKKLFKPNKIYLA